METHHGQSQFQFVMNNDNVQNGCCVQWLRVIHVMIYGTPGKQLFFLICSYTIVLIPTQVQISLSVTLVNILKNDMEYSLYIY